MSCNVTWGTLFLAGLERETKKTTVSNICLRVTIEPHVLGALSLDSFWCLFKYQPWSESQFEKLPRKKNRPLICASLFWIRLFGCVFWVCVCVLCASEGLHFLAEQSVHLGWDVCDIQSLAYILPKLHINQWLFEGSSLPPTNMAPDRGSLHEEIDLPGNLPQVSPVSGVEGTGSSDPVMLAPAHGKSA